MNGISSATGMKVVPAKMLKNRDKGQQGFPAQKGRVGAHRIGTDLGDLQKKGTRRENELEGTLKQSRVETSGKKCSPTKNRMYTVSVGALDGRNDSI